MKANIWTYLAPLNVGNPPILPILDPLSPEKDLYTNPIAHESQNESTHELDHENQNEKNESVEQQPLPFFEEELVLEAVKLIETNKSSGLTHFNNSVLKSALKILITQLTYIFNLSTTNNIFPISWKKALVIPIPKTGNLTTMSNYRPISLLPQPGKILEKLVHNRLVEYIENEKLLC